MYKFLDKYAYIILAGLLGIGVAFGVQGFNLAIKNKVLIDNNLNLIHGLMENQEAMIDLEDQIVEVLVEYDTNLSN